MLPFDNTVKPQGGNTLAYVYNRVTTLPTAAVRAINVEYDAQEAKTTPVTVNLKIFGGKFGLDRVIIEDETQVVDHVQMQLQQKIQATRALFADMFINGDVGSNALQFDGLLAALVGATTEYTPLAPIDLSTSTAIDNNYKSFMDALDKWLATLGGKPTALFMNATMYAVMSSVARRSSYFSTSDKDAFGNAVSKYNGIQFVDIGDKPGTSDPIVATSGGNTKIVAARLALDGVHGVSPSGASLIKQYLPNMQQPGAVKEGEVEMVAACAIKATRSAGVFHDIKIA